ncbi:MAG: hypothetical protein DRI48_05820 [Chloroflexi bacterium]|nr:MAG: hypothetical protein DRI48_05820 [Chloroflexota bacterium]
MPYNRRPERQARLTPFQRILSSRWVTGLGMLLSRHAPPLAGHAIADIISGTINRLRPQVYRIVYANLRPVVGSQASERELHRLVHRVFHNNARNAYELWRLAGRGAEAVRAAVHIPPEVWTYVDQARQRGKGIIIVGTHTGNFDLGILALAAHGLEIQVLGLAEPPAGGFELMDRMRARGGVRLTSIGFPALREAVSRLRAGGIVLTGVDRPVGDEEPTVEFFGRPAPLPTGHVRLALKTDAAIIVAGSYRDPLKGNVVQVSPPLEMVRTGESARDVHVNLRRVTAWLENFVRARPEQWAMFVPVWSELAAESS